MMRTLLDKYWRGIITDDHLIVETLHMIDPARPGEVLSCLPEAILDRMLQFLRTHQDGPLVTNYGALPTRDQIVAASQWIQDSLLQPSTKLA